MHVVLDTIDFLPYPFNCGFWLLAWNYGLYYLHTAEICSTVTYSYVCICTYNMCICRSAILLCLGMYKICDNLESPIPK